MSFIFGLINSNVKKFFFLLLACTFFNSSAQVPLINTYNRSQGLTSEFIKDITQDLDGFIWVGTHKGVFKFDGIQFLPVNLSKKQVVVRKLFVDSSNRMWVATASQGVIYHQDGQWYNLQRLDDVRSFYQSTNNELWVASKNGIKIINKHQQIQDFETLFPYYNDKSVVTNIVSIDADEIVLGFNGGLSILNQKLKTVETFKPSLMADSKINDILVDHHQNLWLATTKSLIHFNPNNEIFTQILGADKEITTASLEAHGNHIYAASYEHGMFKIDIDTYDIDQFKHHPNHPHSLAENTITTVFKSKNNILWIGNFHKGLSAWNLNATKFNYETNIEGSDTCSKSSIYYAGYMDSHNNLWLGTSSGLVKFNPSDKSCSTIQARKEDQNLLSNITTMLEHDGYLYIASFKGLARIKPNTLNVSVVDKKNSYNQLFTDHLNQLYFYNYTAELFKLNPQTTEVVPLKNLNIETSQLRFYDAAKGNNITFLATSKGLAYITQQGHLALHQIANNPQISAGVNAVAVNNDAILLVTRDNSIYQANQNNNAALKFSATSHPELNGAGINKIVFSQDGKEAWMSSEKGLFRIKDDKLHLFQNSDGIGNYLFYDNFAFQNNNQLYFGGQNGFVHFNPQDIRLNSESPNIYIKELSILNKVVTPNQATETGFLLESEINHTELIELSHRDYIIGFEFVALDYAAPLRNQYSYRLKGLSDDWVRANSNQPRVTYTNLKAGDYTFQIKASNKDGTWTTSPKELAIKVYPAPWLSIWAFFAYALILIISAWSYVRYKTFASRKRAQELEAVVAERTQELSLQKKMVESLLDHKNEVLANITHELKTPLALILGPTDQLAEEPDLKKFSDKLSMIRRNAMRLIVMVGHILKLSEAEQKKEVIREGQAVKPILDMLFESFLPLANDKNIELHIHNKIKVNVYATPECLEIVVGNLISNALKYTNSGGKVTIQSELKNKTIEISVTDSGAGIAKENLPKIFQRFKRLDNHKGIQGTGIGLSVVKKITEINHGEVSVSSEEGKGSVFTVSFPVSAVRANKEMSSTMVDQLVANAINENSQERNSEKRSVIGSKNKMTVLSIEDNQDMQEHIGNVLEKRFKCFFASEGKDGIALALKEIPDVIICDVMMPGMDGYQVTRILRHDARTSHIPIILLTALNTKESRIKGWRENIDVYVTKPFDATELNVQIDNILSLRKILQQKTKHAINTNDSIDALDLPQQDQKFIARLKKTISEIYTNEYIQKADIAAKMAISERQLQRKVKALIDEGPMDMLREYRLHQASLKLKEGLLVSAVSDDCGFSSVSYFGSCFKKRYGVTPKQYQNLNKNKLTPK